MDASHFRAVFLALFVCGGAVELILNRLNRREVLRNPVLPLRFTGPEFAGHFDADTFAKSRAYTLERLSFATFSFWHSSALTLGLLFSGILPWYDRLLGRAFALDLNRSALFLAGVVSLQSLVQLPLAAYAIFRIEGRYGFNTMTWGMFWRDRIKGIALSALLGLPLLYALLALLLRLGSAWWLYAFVLLLAFQFILMIVYPLFIAPLFNRFQPLEDGELKNALSALSARLRFPAAGIYVMDGSRRSLHSNAYFTGFGRFRRIVLFDTLIRRMDRTELLGILAHEIGHYKRNHIYKLMGGQILMLGALLYLAALALRWPVLYAAFGFPLTAQPAAGPAPVFAGNPAAGLFLFMTSFSSLLLLLSPLQNFISRRHEYQADAYAVAATRNPAAMRSALIKLSNENLSNLTPHPWYSAFHYSHPTLSERLEAIQGKKAGIRG